MQVRRSAWGSLRFREIEDDPGYPEIAEDYPCKLRGSTIALPILKAATCLAMLLL